MRTTMRRRWAATSDIVLSGRRHNRISRISAFDDFSERRVTWLVAKPTPPGSQERECQPSTAVLSTLELTPP